MGIRTWERADDPELLITGPGPARRPSTDHHARAAECRALIRPTKPAMTAAPTPPKENP